MRFLVGLFIFGLFAWVGLSDAKSKPVDRATLQSYNVCHGQHEFAPTGFTSIGTYCSYHPVQYYEPCRGSSGGGADPRLSCLQWCGQPLGPSTCGVFVLYPGMHGNQCGYSWFQERCYK